MPISRNRVYIRSRITMQIQFIIFKDAVIAIFVRVKLIWLLINIRFPISKLCNINFYFTLYICLRTNYYFTISSKIEVFPFFLDFCFFSKSSKIVIDLSSYTIVLRACQLFIIVICQRHRTILIIIHTLFSRCNVIHAAYCICEVVTYARNFG